MANCRPNIPDFTFPECDFESGRVVAVGFIHDSIHAAILAAPTTAGNWTDGSYTADLHVFDEVRGSLAASPTDVPGLGNQDTRVISQEWTLTFMVEGVRNNHTFWNELVKSHQYKISFVVGQNYDLLFINNTDISTTAFPVIEEGLDSQVLWSVTVKWRDINIPQTSGVPAGVFN